MNTFQDSLWIARSFARATGSSSGHIRIIHFPCRTGELLAYLGNTLRPAVTYGASTYETNVAAEYIDHFCVATSLEDLRISSGAFNLVILDLDRIPQKARVPSIVKARSATAGGNYTVLLFSHLSQDEIKAAAHRACSRSELGKAWALRLTGGRNALVIASPAYPEESEDRRSARHRAAVDMITRTLARPVFERDFDHKFEVHPLYRHKPPTFAPLWLDENYAANIIASFGPWKNGTPPEYLDENPATPNLRPAMPLRRGHLALAAVSGAMGVLKVTIHSRPAALCGRVVREEETSEERSGNTSTTLTSQSFKPEITILFLDNMELMRA
jgi:hypothetical protein